MSYVFMSLPCVFFLNVFQAWLSAASRKEMGISYMKRLAASKAPWPSWEFKQEKVGQKAPCLLGTGMSMEYHLEYHGRTLNWIDYLIIEFNLKCHNCSGVAKSRPIHLQDQFKFCNHTMLGDIKEFGMNLACLSLCVLLPRNEQTAEVCYFFSRSCLVKEDQLHWGRVCCRWVILHHCWWPQADLDVCSSMGGLNLGHWAKRPSRTWGIARNFKTK